MTAAVFYFQVHQPYRLRRRDAARSGTSEHDYFDTAENTRILRRVAERCYVPMNTLLLELIDRHEGAFRCTFSISGTALQQLEAWAPEALDTFVRLAESGAVEFLAETSHHSLASLGSEEEFRAQATAQRARIEQLFGQRPRVFRNTELIVSNAIGTMVEELGFDAILGEGAESILDGRTPHNVYGLQGCEHLAMLLRDYRFSDDIAFRFSNRDWPHYPLMADTFASWLGQVPEDDSFVGLFMDYETFGEHQGPETGLFDFMRWLPRYVLEGSAASFATPSEIVDRHRPTTKLDIPRPTSWADAERDVSAWLGNPMQRTAHESLYALRPHVGKDPELLEDWRRLSTSDHVYYMCTKQRSDGDVHEYFSPYYSPQDAFVLFMRALDDLQIRAGLSRSPRQNPARRDRRAQRRSRRAP